MNIPSKSPGAHEKRATDDTAGQGLASENGEQSAIPSPKLGTTQKAGNSSELSAPCINLEAGVQACASAAASAGSPRERSPVHKVADAQAASLPAPPADASQVSASNSNEKPQVLQATDTDAAPPPAPPALVPAEPTRAEQTRTEKRTNAELSPASLVHAVDIPAVVSQKGRQPQQVKNSFVELQPALQTHVALSSRQTPPEHGDKSGHPGKGQRGNVVKAARLDVPPKEREAGGSRAVRRRFSAMGLLEPDDTVPRQYERDQEDIICVCNVPYKVLYRIGKGGSSRVRP